MRSTIVLLLGIAAASMLLAVTGSNFTLPPLPYGYDAMKSVIDNQVRYIPGICCIVLI